MAQNTTVGLRIIRSTAPVSWRCPMVQNSMVGLKTANTNAVSLHISMAQNMKVRLNTASSMVGPLQIPMAQNWAAYYSRVTLMAGFLATTSFKISMDQVTT